ncbi:chemotaxis protein CheW [Dyella tabacisoli]|uniref:Chemotaxis protein CheW n=1 Tax=Dyella tabacisoli TaxID=2282381 RepID=A0A369UIB1_9GAMM|nr:chemotaxis protein CheW [Dyella tabacisoli]RDD79845.1 chemotaxis protein CheW [Dyella tabacisoli]
MNAATGSAIPPTQWLVFQLADQAYATPLTYVSEIIRDGALTPVPGAAYDVLGIRQLRGQIVPVLDGCRRLGLRPVANAADAQAHIVVLSQLVQSQQAEQIGLRVDAVDGLLTVNESDISAAPSGRALRDSDPVRGVVAWKQGFVALLDVHKLCRLTKEVSHAG